MEVLFILGVMLLTFIVIIVLAVARGNSIDKGLKDRIAQIGDFTPNVSYEATQSKQAIAIDLERRKIAIVSGTLANLYSLVFSFDDLVAAEVTRDDASIHKTNRGSQLAGAAVGGILLGPAGLIVGGLSGSRREEIKIRKVVLRLYTRDLVRPVHEIVFVDGGSAGTDIRSAELFIRLADEWYGRMRGILDGRGSR